MRRRVRPRLWILRLFTPLKLLKRRSFQTSGSIVRILLLPDGVEGVRFPFQALPLSKGGLPNTMFRQRLSQLLAAAAVKVAQDNTPELIRAQLQERKKALISEVNGYRSSLSNFISPK
jgi:hypothetical protein